MKAPRDEFRAPTHRSPLTREQMICAMQVGPGFESEVGSQGTGLGIVSSACVADDLGRCDPDIEAGKADIVEPVRTQQGDRLQAKIL